MRAGGMKIREIAEFHGVKISTVSSVLYGLTWKINGTVELR